MRDHFYEETLGPIIEGGNSTIIDYLQEVGVLNKYSICSSCNNCMELKPYTKNKDEFAFRCMTRKCHKYSAYKSIRKGSIFEKYRFSLRVGMKLLWNWIQNTPQSSIKKEINVDKKVLIDFFDDLRLCCRDYFKYNPICLGGGDKVCQIDESLFRHKPKYHRGRASKNELWVFGIAEVSETRTKIYLELVQNRSADVLLPIIKRICRQGTTILSDQWRSYNKVSSSGFRHETVNHSLHFVDPNTGVNTQTIESYWGKLKYRVKTMKGVLGVKLDLYLTEWMWKDNIYCENWNNLLDLIKIEMKNNV